MEIGRGKRLLLVEDEDITARVTAKRLNKSGYDVVIASNGIMAVDIALSDTSVDLILMDIDLGSGINGPEAARRILKTQNIPIVFLTSHSEEDVVEMVKAITRYGYVIKNSGDFVLLSSIEMAFELFDSHKKLKASAEYLRHSEERVRSKLDSILFPEGDVGWLELSDVIDIPMLQSILEYFYTITNFGVGIIDLHGKVLISTGWRDICTKFHRVNPESCMNCVESNTTLSYGIASGTYKLYKCKNNMWNIATPINVGGKHVGNLILGQFLFVEDVIDYDVFRKQALRFGFDEKEYIDALDRVPRWSRDTVYAAMAFYIKLLSIISKLSYSNIKLAKTLSERDRFSDLNRANEELLSDVTDNMVDLVARLDSEGYFKYVSPSYERVLGYRPDEMVGTRPQDIFYPSTKDKNIREITGICSDGKGSVEFRLRHKDGTYRWFEATGRNVYNEDGIVNGAVLGGRDITQRKIAEKRFSKRDKQYKELFESMIDGFALHEIVVDDWGNPIDYIFLEVNPAFEGFTGFYEKDIIGKRVTELMPDIEPYWITTYGQVAFTGVQLTIENFSKTLNKWFKVTAYSSERGYFATIFEDITDRKMTEDILKERDERYRRLFESVVGYVYTVYIEKGNPVKTIHGPGCEAITGYTPDDFASDPELWYKMIYPDDRGRVILFASDIINKGVFNPVEHRIHCCDGSLSWVRNTPVPHYEGDILVEYDSLIVDITESKIAEISMKESESRFRNLFEHIPIAYHSLDAEGRLIDVNENWLKMTGYCLEEIIGKSFGDFWIPEMRDQFPVRFKGLLASGVIDDAEISLNKKNGEKLTVILTGRVQTVRRGGFEKTHCVMIDISQRKEIADMIQDRSEFVNSVLNSLSANIAVLDERGVIIAVNDAWKKFSKENSTGKEFFYLGGNYLDVCKNSIEGDDEISEDMLNGLNSVMSGEKDQFSLEYACHSPEMKRWYKVRVTKFSGKEPHFVVAHEDVTARKVAEWEIQSLLKEKELLLREVHHRIKNNMNSISGLLMLQAASMNDGPAVAALIDAQNRIHSMMIMYDKLYMSADYRKIQVKEYLVNFIEEIYKIFENQGKITIEQDIDDFILNTKILFPLGIILNEIITNAFKYAFPDGREGVIKVSAKKVKEKISICIKDNGVGFTDEDLSSKPECFGLNLVYALTEQIRGECKITQDNGTSAEIFFTQNI